ncbi:precorrin-3B synthase [soil metagenome]
MQNLTDHAVFDATGCPGLFRMRPARDGAICRVKLELGVLSAAQAETIADVAEEFGNGIIEATNRGNLQLRGMWPETAGEVIRRLLEAGLGPRVPQADDIRNVMVSPLAGRDPAAICDVRPLARQVLATLQANPRYFSLSPKFSILVDGGEAMAMTGHAHDIWLSATADGFAIGIAGWPPLMGEPHAVLGAVESERAHEAVVALLEIFLEARIEQPDATRFRHVTAHTVTIGNRLRGRIALADIGGWHRTPPVPFMHIGVHPQSGHGLMAVGGMPPLGRLDPASLRQLADLSRAGNGGTIHVTPWQSILLPDIPAPRADAVAWQMTAIGLACDVSAPLSGMIACSGSAGCMAALADTQRDARLLAGMVGGTSIHVSGCPKSCAAAHVVSVTLIAASPGHYDVFVKDNGDASRFGRRVAAHATIAEAAAAIAENRSLPRA